MPVHFFRHRTLSLLPAAVGLGLLVLLSAAPAAAVTYTYPFEAITSNYPANAAAGEAQLRMDVTGESGSATVTFTFYHDGTTPMSITDIYFYFGGGWLEFWSTRVTAFAGFTYSPSWNGQSGVNYTLIAWPLFLPGGGSAGLPWYSLVFSCDSAPPVVPKGVNPGEKLGISFTLADSYDVDDIVSWLNGWIGDTQLNFGDLAVGLHVQGFSGGGSESFVVGAQVASPVPLPGSAWLLGSGLVALALLARCRRSHHAPRG